MSHDLSGELSKKIVSYNKGKLYDNIYSSLDALEGIIFNASSIDHEIFDFLSNNTENKFKIYLFFEQDNIQLIEDALNLNIYTIVPHNTTYKKKHKKIIKYNYYYSKSLVSTIKKSNKRSNNVICDISGISSLPDALLDSLYPKTKEKINLFNNTSLRHQQNLGVVENESIFLQMISECRAYIDINQIYLAYALYFDTPTISLSKNNLIKKSDAICINNIETKLNDKSILDNYHYVSFIEKYIL